MGELGAAAVINLKVPPYALAPVVAGAVVVGCTKGTVVVGAGFEVVLIGVVAPGVVTAGVVVVGVDVPQAVTIKVRINRIARGTKYFFILTSTFFT